MVTYEEFTRWLVERIERRDLEISFKDITHVKKTGTHEVYIYEFQKLVVMVSEISETHLILLFIEGIKDPLKVLVKAYRLSTLKDAFNRTRYLQVIIPRKRFPNVSNVPTQYKNQTTTHEDFFWRFKEG